MTAKNHDIRVRVTKDQLDRIQNNMRASGSATIADYLRKLALGNGLALEQRVKEIHERVCGKYGPPDKYKVPDRYRISPERPEYIITGHGSYTRGYEGRY